MCNHKWEILSLGEFGNVTEKFFNFNLLWTHQINCNRLAVYPFAYTNAGVHDSRTKATTTTFYLHLIIFALKTCTTVTQTEHSSSLVNLLISLLCTYIPLENGSCVIAIHLKQEYLVEKSSSSRSKWKSERRREAVNGEKAVNKQPYKRHNARTSILNTK